MAYSSPLLKPQPELKPLSSFLSNVLRNNTLTLEQVVALNALPTPHLQFAAVMQLRRRPELPLDQILHEMQQQSACKPVVLPAKTKLRMSNKRWIEIAVLGVAIPLVHGIWSHLGHDGIALAHASSASASMSPVTLQGALIQNPVFVTHRLQHAHRTPHVSVVIEQPPSEQRLEPENLIDKNMEAAAADLAAAEAMPITSRR